MWEGVLGSLNKERKERERKPRPIKPWEGSRGRIGGGEFKGSAPAGKGKELNKKREERLFPGNKKDEATGRRKGGKRSEF